MARRDRFLRLDVRGDVPVEMIDERGVEMTLRFERRSDEPPDEAAQATLERAVDRRRAVGRMFQASLTAVSCVASYAGGGCGNFRHRLRAPIERGQRVVVASIRFVAFALEPG